MKAKKYLKTLNCWLFGHRINVYMLLPPGSDPTPCVKCGKMFSYPASILQSFPSPDKNESREEIGDKLEGLDDWGDNWVGDAKDKLNDSEILNK